MFIAAVIPGVVLAAPTICYSIPMSLIPDKPLIFFPHVASTLGLEEAILLQALKEVCAHHEAIESNGYLWTELPGHTLLELLPFWSATDIRRLATNLHDQGVLLIDTANRTRPFDGQQVFRFAFNEGRASESTTHKNATTKTTAELRVAPKPAAPGPSTAAPIHGIQDAARTGLSTPHRPAQSRNLMSRDWQPEADILAQLSQYGIPESFALEQVPEFVTYWNERAEPRHSWGSKFIKQVLKLWREQEAHEARRQQEVTIDCDWQPSPEALEILLRADISRNFIDDAIPEFILYWRDRGTQSSTWNTQFIQHIRRQWAKYQSALTGKGDNEFRPMSANWRPDETVYDILAMASIERGFAEQLVPEFILYWQESGQSLNSWNTKFLQYVKRQWAYHNNTSVTRHATQQTPGRTGSTRHRDLVEELSDRSWAS